ncbi:hypothetical protein F5148DRAFT_521363 [Russula earlei]|uniref:Uncharacterized protein n=1 Tax=Russula earlei TaxID=71964 RepID=A0ACC0TWY5_9AGAM|nr:hypothetical protein F5148DRAFT_521363 [Russula earlei]
MLCCLPQGSPLNATKPMVRWRLQKQKQQLCVAPPRGTTTEWSTHMCVHALPLSTTGWSTLMPPSSAFLPHAPACDDLEHSIIPLFGASSSSLLSLSVASSLSSCTMEDLGDSHSYDDTTRAENSTLDSLTGDSQNFMPLGGRCIVDCGWPRNSLLHGYIITPIVHPITSRLPSRHLPHVPRPQCSPPPIATCQRSHRRRRLDASCRPV